MASTRATTYSADQVTASLAGVQIDSGTSDGEFVTVEPAAEGFTAKVGSDGEVARSKTNNRMATVKLKLLHTSASNTYLSTLYATDINTPGGAGVGRFELRDLNNGAIIVEADKAWIEKVPNGARAREVSDNEWTIRLASANWDFSGYPSL